MFFFAYGIDPLITFLERRLTGILICSMPVFGPTQETSRTRVLPPFEERYKVVSYADDLKPAVVTMEEFSLVDNASALFEAASGCRLHRDPASLKCKFLPLGRWRRTLQQEDLPRKCQYMILSEHLDMVGVQLRATWTQTRKANCDIIQQRVTSIINSWKSGKFMPLVLRPWSIGCPILVKSLNLVPLIRVPIRIDILGRFLHFQSFRATFTIPQLTCKFCYILIIFALREDLICHFSITYCLRYQGDRVLFRLFCFFFGYCWIMSEIVRYR